MENLLRIKAGTVGYSDSLVEHYLVGIIYPDGLTRNSQYLLGVLVLLTNIAIYGWVYARFRHRN